VRARAVVWEETEVEVAGTTAVVEDWGESVERVGLMAVVRAAVAMVVVAMAVAVMVQEATEMVEEATEMVAGEMAMAVVVTVKAVVVTAVAEHWAVAAVTVVAVVVPAVAVTAAVGMGAGVILGVQREVEAALGDKVVMAAAAAMAMAGGEGSTEVGQVEEESSG